MKFKNRIHQNAVRINVHVYPETLEQICLIRRKYGFGTRAGIIRACVEDVYEREMGGDDND